MAEKERFASAMNLESLLAMRAEMRFVEEKVLYYDALELFNPKQVLDIGSGDGFYLEQMSEIFSHADIVALEPDSTSFKMLEKRFRGKSSILSSAISR